MNELRTDKEIIQGTLNEVCNKLSTPDGKFICRILIDLCGNMANLIDTHEVFEKMKKGE